MVSEDGVAFARGTQVEMEFDEEQFVGGGVYLFATVLEYFLGLYVSMNSFSQLVCARGRERRFSDSGRRGRDRRSCCSALARSRDDCSSGSPTCFEFFQAVRLLERMHAGAARWWAASATRPTKWCASAPIPSVAFPASEIQSLKRAPDGTPSMRVNFMGLIGPWACCRMLHANWCMSACARSDTTLRDFLDIFNHRMISLFYQAWEKYRFTFAYERGERDRFSHHCWI